jgi:hypothetical protein
VNKERQMSFRRTAGAMARVAMRWAFLGAGLLVASPIAADDLTYQVVVNAQNPVGEMSRADVSKMFLKQLPKWPDGRYVVPVDQSANAPVRAGFCTGVHHQSPQAVQSYWQKEIHSRRGVPPFVKVGDAEVMAFVASNTAAVGYVSGSAGLAPGVKVLRLKD